MIENKSNGLGESGKIITITELAKWCKRDNKHIVIHSGKLCGIGVGY